ncbi:MAG TPA: hypothetical protein VJ385_22735 [Fibrobacteria bacterium]|nr:hypothetical protein [Fibrobacteria bacterium]
MAALGILAPVLFAAVYFGGRWAAQKYLAEEIKVGEGRVRLVSPRFRWSLDLSADSALYLSPTLDVAAGRTVVSANLFRSLLRFGPSVTLDVDTLTLRIAPGPDTVKPKRDSIPFPEVRIPAAVLVRAGRILVSDTAGLLVRCDGLVLETQGPQGARLAIREAEARPLGGLRQSLAASAAWDDSTRVLARLAWRRAGDSISLDVRMPKANLLRAAAELRVHLASSRPYAEALKLPPAPRAEGFDAAFRATLGRTLSFEGGLDARVSGFPDSLPLKLGPQKLAVRLAFKDSAGTWSVKSRGDGGEDVDLGGTLYVTKADSLADPAWLARHAGATAKGHLRGFTVVAGGKRGQANLEVAGLRASGEAIQADIATGDGSRIAADLRLAAAAKPATRAAKTIKTANRAKGRQPASQPGLPDWNGTFSVRIAPGERWMVAFTDTNVVFKKAQVNGRIAGGEVTALVEASGLKAYGLMADSLRLVNRYGKGGYVLEPSHLVWRGVDWELAGRVGLDKPGRPMEFRMGNPKYGSVEAAMPRPDVMEARVRGLALEQSPYKGLDTLRANQPRVTADFQWDKPKRTGTASIKVDGRYKNETLQAVARAEWDAQTLTVSETRASLSGNEIHASAKVNLRGRQFYELAKLAKEDVEEASLGADRFDLAKAMAVAMPEPPLKSGVAIGRLGYGSAGGFSGACKLENIHLSGEEEKVAIKELAVAGKGDTLVIKAVTVSEEEPLLRDSATLAVAGILTPTQTLTLDARAGQGVFLDFRGTVKDFKDLKGRLGIRGDMALPKSSGELKNVKVRADIVMPFKDGIKGLRVEADTLGGVYVVAGLDTQTFSAPVKMEGGRITIPRLTVKSAGGAELRGRFELDPATKRMSGSLTGNSFAAQFGPGDRIKLRDLKLDLRGDSTVLDLQASIGSGSAEHIKAPMRAAGDFSRVSVTYRAPLGKDALGAPGGGRIPYVRVDAVLDSSELRYRLRSMETLQNLFKRTPEKRAAKRSQAMQVQINVETSGRGNSIETDILRLNYVGNFSMAGTYPYALVQGRISSQKGELGVKKQAYAIRRMDLKWLNTPMEEGKVELEAQKRLARNCEAGTLDSCNITTRLTGELSDLQFTYDSDCEGASGAGVEVSALVYSVRRGCYSSAMRGGGSGLSYEEQALGLLEPLASGYLSDAFGKLSGHWISNVQVSGLGSLASDKKKADTAGTSTAQEAIALELLSKEFWRTRLRVKSAYAPENDESSNPWNYRVGLEWRPPTPGFIEDPKWRERLKNNVNVEAAIFTDPDRTQENREDESLRKRLGLNYTYDFWGSWWAKKRENLKTAQAPDSTR